MTRTEYNKLMAWSKDGMGAYTKIINNNEYKVEQNENTKEWHLYINGEWSTDVIDYKDGKLMAIAIENNLI